MNDVNWKEIVEKARLYKELGQTDHYIYGDVDAPWEFVVSCTPGGSHRLDIATSVSFIAEHPCGLKFRWSFDLEERGANGKSHYEINTEGVIRVLASLPKKAAANFRSYLADCAVAVQKSADKYRSVAEAEANSAATLKRLANQG
jgi:hypothetical protein